MIGIKWDQPNSATGTRTRVTRARAEYPDQLDYSRCWYDSASAGRLSSRVASCCTPLPHLQLLLHVLPQLLPYNFHYHTYYFSCSFYYTQYTYYSHCSHFSSYSYHSCHVKTSQAKMDVEKHPALF